MKLYWRYKKDGKWTWKSAKATDMPEWQFLDKLQEQTVEEE